MVVPRELVEIDSRLKELAREYSKTDEEDPRRPEIENETQPCVVDDTFCEPAAKNHRQREQVTSISSGFAKTVRIPVGSQDVRISGSARSERFGIVGGKHTCAKLAGVDLRKLGAKNNIRISSKPRGVS